MTTYARQDMTTVSVTVDGRDCGEFQKSTGGGGTADSKKVAPGAGLPAVALGGPATSDDVTLTKMIDIEGTNATGGFANDIELFRWLRGRRGRGRCIVKAQPLDGEYSALTITKSIWTGILGAVTPGDTDADGGDEDTFQIVVSTDASIN